MADPACGSVGLDGASSALGTALGSGAKYVFAVGVLAAGQASTMTGTYAGQYVMEGFLQLKIPNWARVAMTRLCSLGPAILVALATSSNKEASDTLDEWLNILQSVQLPFALLPVLHFTSSRRVMGQFCNTSAWNLVCWFLAVLVMIANVYLVVSTIQDPNGPAPHSNGFTAIVIIFAILYFAFVGFLVRDDLRDLFGPSRSSASSDLKTSLLDESA